MLRIRITQILKQNDVASKDLLFLHKTDSTTAYLSLVEKQIRHYENSREASHFIKQISPYYAKNNSFKLTLAESYARFENDSEAKNTLNSIHNKLLDAKQKYRLRSLLKKLNKNTIGLNHELLTFLADFPIRSTWHSTQVSYMHSFKEFTLMGSILHSNRFADQGTLYEATSYAMITPSMYGFLKLGTSSKSNFYQNFGADASIFQTIFKSMELEIGGKYLNFGEQNFVSGVVGLTLYTGSFYLNGRSGIGPKIQDRLVQNYQATARYYLQNSEDYLFFRIGTGISPDESAQFTQLVTNPNLNSYFALTGISKWFGNINMGLTIGYQYQELSKNRIGNQLIGSVNLKYRL